MDIVITGSQKALMLPPGLAFLSVSEKAQKKAAAVKQPNLYLDLDSYLKSYNENDVPWTPAVTLVRGLFVALYMIQAEGIEECLEAHQRLRRRHPRRGQRAGSGRLLQEPSDSVTGINYPAGFTDKEFRGAFRKQLNMNVAAGQGSMEGKIFRISHMGYVDQADTLGVIHGVEIILRQQGYKFEFGAGRRRGHKELAKLQGGAKSFSPFVDHQSKPRGCNLWVFHWQKKSTNKVRAHSCSFCNGGGYSNIFIWCRSRPNLLTCMSTGIG